MSLVRVGESLMSCWPAVTLAEFILSSLVLRVMDVVSSTTSRLAACQQASVYYHGQKYILNGDSALVSEVDKVWLQSQVIVQGLDIGRQHLTAFGNVNGRLPFSAEVFAHASSVRAVPDGDGGRMSDEQRWRRAKRCVLQRGKSSGVSSTGRGARERVQ